LCNELSSEREKERFSREARMKKAGRLLPDRLLHTL